MMVLPEYIQQALQPYRPLYERALLPPHLRHYGVCENLEENPGWLGNSLVCARGDKTWNMVPYQCNGEIQVFRLGTTTEEANKLSEKYFPNAVKAGLTFYSPLVQGSTFVAKIFCGMHVSSKLKETMDYLDVADPMPRPPYMIGQCWLGATGREYLLTHKSADYLVCTYAYRSDGRTHLVAAQVKQGETKIHIEMIHDELVALLHGPSPWGRDVLWVDRKSMIPA